MKIRIFAVFLLVSLAGHAQAVEFKGAVTCEQWLQEEEQAKTGEIWPHMISRFWLQGFLSGMAAGTQKDILVGVSGQYMRLRVHDYCVANTGKLISDAALALGYELIKKKR